MKKIAIFTLLLALTLLIAACATEPAPATTTATAGSAAADDTATPLPTETPAATPSATPSASAAPAETETPPGEAQATPTVVDAPLLTMTPYPGPTPTAAPLNEPVPQAQTGEYECGDYPCFDDAEAWEARIRLPEGFVARYYAQVEPHPTSLQFGPDGLLYVARQEGEIVTVDDAGNVQPYLDGFYHLVSLAFQPGTERLFAASRAEGNDAAIIWVVEEGQATPLFDDLPCCYGGWHQANGIAFGPDGYGYVGLGALSDHGESQPLHPLEATVLRFDPGGEEVEVFASGLRNTFDITWDGAGRLFGSDNGPDHGPPEEFHLIEPGGHHGFPYYEGCESCPEAPADLEIVAPVQQMLARSAPTGVTSYLHEHFPGYYNNLFLTLWSAFPGAQKVVRFGPGGEGMTDFATGFAAPVDVTVGPDGALFVADWATGVIFEIRYEG
ncbi:MAG: PQQ-dependent sugar dehydrogenase [Chloroflexota bacterium]